MKLKDIYFISLIIIFIILFVLSFYYIDNKVIKYRVSKEILPEEELDYKKLKNKYTITKCNQMCKKELCNNYENQVIMYDLCKDCSKNNQCYDPFKGICGECLNNQTCEETFGCNGGGPINPKNNLCKKCWESTV
jgi:hypothetical protein